jgi:ATP-binding cassette subfamily F protein 3
MPYIFDKLADEQIETIFQQFDQRTDQGAQLKCEQILGVLAAHEAEDLAVKAGKFRWGYGLKVGYYAQHVFSTLDPKSDVYTHMASVAALDIGRQEILNLAGSFLFKGDDVKKKISVLSGGERARLCLAGLLLTKSNVLLLDEPTNHLDFETVEALGRALKSFTGTLFFISHDRTFVNLVASEIVEVNNGSVKVYPGTYEEYVYRMEKALQEELAGNEPASVTSAAKPAAKGGKDEYQARKALESEKRKLTSRIAKTDAQIAEYKKEYEAIGQEFAAHPDNWSHERHARYEELARLLDAAQASWLELTQKLEAL